MATHLFLDFDGTISIGDIGDKLFQTFGSFEPVHSQLIAGEFSVAEYYRRSVALLPEGCTPATLEAFANEQSLDPGFVPLVTWSKRSGIDVTIVSDGFDVYIEPLLRASGQRENVDVACNQLTWNGIAFAPSFPGASESCACFCASCKRNAVITRLGDNDIAIYVGDGSSDSCAVEFADVVFAKGTLAAECTRKGTPHHPYRTLSEVMIILQEKVGKGALRVRRQAVLARKRAFEAE
ncbi:MAG: MtnX-like HAD-IB family phosphatase [Candidatus Kapabacteria bacterium]|nr:MtnX-like HAD-IB family phosphatase [Candidatus Kapabacteria bacterium]